MSYSNSQVTIWYDKIRFQRFQPRPPFTIWTLATTKAWTKCRKNLTNMNSDQDQLPHSAIYPLLPLLWTDCIQKILLRHCRHAWNEKMDCFEWSCRYISTGQYTDLVLGFFFFLCSSHSSHIQEHRSQSERRTWHDGCWESPGCAYKHDNC
jgi:hypothetical protein